MNHPIDTSFLSRFCTDRLGRAAIRTEKISGLGFVNEVYRAVFPDCSRILRFRAGQKAFREFRKEAYCMEQARALGIPTADVTGFGLYDGTAYLVESCLEGTNGSLLPHLADAVWEKLGGYARLLHNAPVSGYGPEFSEDNRFTNSFSPTLRAHLQYNLDCIVPEDILIRLGVYPAAKIGEIRALISGLLAENLPTGLIHGDLSLKNTIIGDEVYLIDYGCAFVGVVPFEEIISAGSQLEGHLPAFLKGYGSPEQLIRSSAFRGMALVSAFDKLRWALDNGIADKEHYLEAAKKEAAALFGAYS